MIHCHPYHLQIEARGLLGKEGYAQTQVLTNLLDSTQWFCLMRLKRGVDVNSYIACAKLQRYMINQLVNFL